MKLQRKTLGSLLSSYYVRTFIFATVSMISYLINPTMVPGRMGMIVTLLLISSNVYTNVNAPRLYSPAFECKGKKNIYTRCKGNFFKIVRPE